MLKMEKAAQHRVGGPLAFVKGLRLLMVADSSSTHTQRWAQHFVGRGAEVTVLSCRNVLIHGVEVIPFPMEEKWYHRVPKLRVAGDYWPFRRLVREIDPQLIHFHFVSEGGRTFYWNGIDVPMIASTWGQDVIFDNGAHRGAEESLRRMLGRCRFVTATTHQLAAATARYTPEKKPIYVIPFGVDLSRFSLHDIEPSDTAVIGFVKHLLPKYGPDVLVEAFARVHEARPNTRLVMAGRGSMRETLEKRVGELGLTDAVEFLGRVPHEQVPDLVRTFDVMAMPSVYESETFGVAAIEASACGVPVVASRIGGVPEAVLHEKTGLLVPPGDVEALAAALIELIDDPGRRCKLGLAGRRFVQRYYSWQENAKLMEEVYRAAVEGDEPRDVPVWQAGVEPAFDVGEEYVARATSP